MFTLMLPCAGSSSRYPNMRPKWSLTHPNGRLMVTQGISGIDFSNFDSICMAVLKSDLEKYKLCPCPPDIKYDDTNNIIDVYTDDGDISMISC